MSEIKELAAESSPAKRLKTSTDVSVNQGNISLCDVSVLNKLSDNTRTKTVCLEGKFKGYDDRAVFVLEKTPFSESNIEQILSSETNLEKVFHNDIYGKYDCIVPQKSNLVKMTVIHPATSKHIEKYKQQHMCIIEESKEDYQKITKPYIKSQQFSLQWVYNILEHKAEMERIVIEDTDDNVGFVLIPDLKWNEKELEDLYLCCICKQREIASIRELNGSHLPLLKNIQQKCLLAIKNKYNVPREKVRAYFHYQPSYYHLHVHFTHLKFEAPGTNVERAHLLSTVISNLENFPDYYEKTRLSFLLKENDGLCMKFKETKEI